MRIGIALTFILFTTFVEAQTTFVTKKTADKKALKYYEKAQEYNRAEDWQNALKQLEKAAGESPDFIDVYLAKAAIYYDQGDFNEAKANFEKAFALNINYRPRAIYQLAITEQKLRDFASAAEHFEQFIQLEKRNQGLIQRARRHLENARFAKQAIANPVPFTPKKLNGNINTADPEVLPALTADGEFLIFTRLVNRQEDLFISKLVDGEWQVAKPLVGINSSQNEGTQSISADGKFLVFTACNRKGGAGSCDLYYSAIQDNQWISAQNMGSPINSRSWESTPSISANSRTLFFASDRPGGQGGRDLWVSYLEPDGWSLPVNLGPNINSSGDEQSPFIHADGQTLYFMSDGLTGMGNFDLYFSKKQEDGTWGKPQNLGYPINTTANEGAMIVSLDGKTAYFATDKKLDETTLSESASLKADADIYQFDLPASARPNPVTYLKAEVFDAVTQEKLSAIAEINELASGNSFIKVRADKSGQFLICIPAGQSYALNVAKAGYLFYSENFDLTTDNSLEEPYVMKIGLTPIPEEAITENIPPSQPIILKNVFFESASAALKPTSRIELNRLRDLLIENPSLTIQINGHTDNVGSENDNQLLSEARAKAVMTFLIDEGINAARLQAKGYGESQPIDTNDTPDGRQNNRRTEFVVLNK